MYRNLTDRHTILARECKAGETFRIRTRKYNAPYVLLPDAVMRPPEAKPAEVGDDVVVEVPTSKAKPTAEFLPDEAIPEKLRGTTAFVPELKGVSVIRVQRRCLLYVAASWDHDGNSSGQWTEERWSQDQFLERGWTEVGKVTIKVRGTDQPHVLFVRECDKGDHFRIRTRKYGAPYVFLPSE